MVLEFQVFGVTSSEVGFDAHIHQFGFRPPEFDERQMDHFFNILVGAEADPADFDWFLFRHGLNITNHTNMTTAIFQKITNALFDAGLKMVIVLERAAHLAQRFVNLEFQLRRLGNFVLIIQMAVGFPD